MDFGNMLSDLAIGAGQSQIAGAEQQQRQAQADNTRAQAQMAQMQALAMKQDMADKKAYAASMAPSLEAFTASAKTDKDILDVSRKGAAEALAHNQFSVAKAYEDMAHLAIANQKEAVQTHALEQHARMEAVGTAALNYDQNPSPATAREMVQAALTAGESVATIPPSSKPDGTPNPDFVNWAKSKKEAGLDSGKRVEFLQKEADIKAKQEELAAQHRQQSEDRAAARSDKALAQQQMHEDRRFRDQMLREAQEARREDAKARQEAKAAGTTLTAKQKDTADAVAVMAHEGARSLHGFGQMEAGATTGAFVDLSGHGVMASLTKVGGRVVTDEQAQMLQTNAAGWGRAVLSAETVGIGRSPTAAQIDDIHRAVTPQAGDTYYTAAYKLATGNAIILNRLETRHTNPDPKVEAQLQKDEDYMRSLATPEQVYAAAQQDPTGKRELSKSKRTSDQLMQEIRSGAFAERGTPMAPPAAVSNDGWSIKPKS